MSYIIFYLNYNINPFFKNHENYTKTFWNSGSACDPRAITTSLWIHTPPLVENGNLID